MLAALLKRAREIQQSVWPIQKNPVVTLPKVAAQFDPNHYVVVLPSMPELYTVLDWINTNSNGSVTVKTVNAVHQYGEWWVLSSGAPKTFAAFALHDDYLRYKLRYERN